jgi:hypothetical protein
MPLFNISCTQAVLDVANAGAGKGRLSFLDVKAQCNACSNAGARALCRTLIDLRESNVAAVRAIHLWKNELGDDGARSIAELVERSAIDGEERFWVAEVGNRFPILNNPGSFFFFVLRYARSFLSNRSCC